MAILNDDFIRENVKLVMKYKRDRNKGNADIHGDDVLSETLDLLDKIDEARLLRDVAKENWEIVKSGEKHNKSNTINALMNNKNNNNNNNGNIRQQQQQQQQQKQQKTGTKTKQQQYKDSRSKFSQKSTTITNPTMNTTSNNSKTFEVQRSDSFVKKEVVKVDNDDDMPRWLRIIDCGSDSMIHNLCGGSSSSTSLSSSVATTKKQQTSNQHSMQGTSSTSSSSQSTTYVNGSTHTLRSEEKTQEILSPLKDKVQKRYGKKVQVGDEIQVLRSTSAPADLTPQEEEYDAPSTTTATTSLNAVNADMTKLSIQQQKKKKKNRQQHQEAEFSSTQEESKEIITNTDSKEQYESDLQRALYLSGLEFQSTKTSSTTYQQKASSTDLGNGKYSVHTSSQNTNLKKINSDEAVDVQTLSVMYKEDFEEMQKSHDIEVSYVDTYQGRIPGSCNGCTVIAPLLALHYLCDEKCLSERSDILMEGISHQEQAIPTSVVRSGTTTTTTLSSEGREENKYDPSATSITSSSTNTNSGIENETVRAVIDIQAPIVLPKVRGGLGLHPDALIIPSDVHDFLMKINMLKQNQFVDVCTGNILDDIHLSKFIETLAGTIGNNSSHDDKSAASSMSTASSRSLKKKKKNGTASTTTASRTTTTVGNHYDDDKLAATFFFHEHVISIHKITKRTATNVINESNNDNDQKNVSSKKRFFSRRFGKNRKKQQQQKRSSRSTLNEIPECETLIDEEIWFEIIDSLPGVSMLGNHYSQYMKQQCQQQFHTSNQDLDAYWLESTARIRCNGLDSLHAALRWYACSKFTCDDQKFINTYHWDHLNIDFDPRVFQAFIWSAAG